MKHWATKISESWIALHSEYDACNIYCQASFVICLLALIFVFIKLADVNPSVETS